MRRQRTQCGDAAHTCRRLGDEWSGKTEGPRGDFWSALAEPQASGSSGDWRPSGRHQTPEGGELSVRRNVRCVQLSDERTGPRFTDARLEQTKSPPQVKLMSPRARLYVLLVAAGAVALIAASSAAAAESLTLPAVVGWLTFVALGLFSETMAVHFEGGPTGKIKASIVFLPLFACAIVFSPLAVILAVVVVQGLSEILFKPRAWWRTVFNVSQYVISYGAAAWVYSLVRSAVQLTGDVHVLAFAAMAVTFFCLNLLLVVGILAIQSDTRFSVVLQKAVGPGGGNLLYDLLASPIAVFAAILYFEVGIAGLLFFLLPLFLVRFSYLDKLRLEQATKDLLRVLIKTIETRDPYTSGHSMRVSILARSIAVDMDLPKRTLQKVESAALLHDIGKVDVIYSEIISKPYDLTPDERELIKTHAARGADLLQSLSLVTAEIVEAVRHHHERYDGRGYPAGISGGDIPLISRLIMVSDSIDAMLSDRPYRSALSVEEVEAELHRCSGTQFDPSVVQAILRAGTLRKAEGLVAEHRITTGDASVLG